MTDWERLAAARAGDGEAWRRLVAEHGPALQRAAYAVTGDAETARDVAQECFLRLLKRDPPERSGRLRAYLAVAAWRLGLQALRAGKRRAPLGETDPPSPDADALAALLAREREERALAAVAALDEGHRQVLVLRLHAGLSVAECAAATGLPEGTVKSRLHHALRACRARLGKEGLL